VCWTSAPGRISAPSFSTPPPGKSSASTAADHNIDAAVAGVPTPGRSNTTQAARSCLPPGTGGRAATCTSREGTAQGRFFLARATFRVTMSTAMVAARMSHPRQRTAGSLRHASLHSMST
jgi:hypothetical protein